MFWEKLTQALSFTGVKDPSVWQDILIGSILVSFFLLPLSLKIYKKVGNWWLNSQPLQLLLKGFLNPKKTLLIFLSQLSAFDDKTGQINYNQKYIIWSPNPLPTNKNAFIPNQRQHIDPVWSEGDGECLADIYNVLGKAGRPENLEVSSLIHDWNKWSSPIFSIGFNPKTHDLEKKCEPIYYKYQQSIKSIIKIKGHTIELDDSYPNDAAIVQKTFLKGTGIPVFILAGHGWMGTSSAGYFLRENCVDIGKLYGNEPFCFLLYVNMQQGRSSVVAKAVYPKPHWKRFIFYLPTYIKFMRKSIFPK